MHTQEDIITMHNSVQERANELLVRLEAMEHKHRMGLCTERDVSQLTQSLASQMGALSALSWVLGGIGGTQDA